jgi:hypothetical protein
MARGDEDAGRISPFERMLDELDDGSEKDEFTGVERVIWPRASPLSRGEIFLSGEAVESLYVESVGAQTPPQELHHPPRGSSEGRQNIDLAADFAGLRHELAAARGPDELRQLRRRCALILHPDRVALLDRALAEKFMAEVNAAIDCAIRSPSPSGKRRTGARSRSG